MEPDKTLRPESESMEEKTLRPQATEEKTLRPQAAEEKTLRPQGNTDKTMRPTAGSVSESTLRPTAKKDNREQIVERRQEYELGGKKYEFVKVISDTTGEAEILLVKYKANEYVLKLYFAHVKAEHTILEKVRKAQGSGLLVDVLEHGVWTNPDNTSEQRDYELMTYCRGGSLDELNVGKNADLLGRIIVQAAMCINFLHKQNLIHRDIKPANFLFTGEKNDLQTMVLSDFGIAIECDNDHKALSEMQMRTKIFAAPDFYFTVQDEKGVYHAQIYDKSDFYSLGMMLLTLWTGDDIFRIDEFELVNMKKSGKLPYPEDMPERLLELLKALTVSDSAARAGYSEIVKWTKGEKIYDLNAGKNDLSNFRIVFNAAKKQIASSPQELVSLMLEDTEIAKKYLYGGKISKWLEENQHNELAIEIEEIVEKQYPKNQTAGLMAACYFLDDELPYTDEFSDKKATDGAEIAAILQDNQSKYADLLKDSNALLWVFFRQRGGGDIVEKFSKLFGKDKKQNLDAVRSLIYTLDKTLPYRITNEDGKHFDCHTVEDVINVCYNEIPSDDSWNSLILNSFFTWLQNINPAIAGKVLSTPGHDTNPWCVLYNLSPKVSFSLQTDEKADDYYFDLKALCSHLDDCMVEYLLSGKDNNSCWSDILDMVDDIDDTRLYYYMRSKGWDKQIKYIKNTMNTKSKENKEKYAPNDRDVCFYKTLKGLGFDPSYYFPKSKKDIYSLEELETIPEKEISSALKKGNLREYLTIFYHENPFLDLTPQFTFEKETVKYLEKLEELNPKEAWVQKFRTGTCEVERAVKKNKRFKSLHLWSKLIFSFLTFVVSGLAIYEAVELVLPKFNGGSVVTISIIVIALALWAFLFLFQAMSLFGSGAIAVGCYVLLSVIFNFTFTYLNYVVAAVLFIWLLIAIITGLIKNNPYKSISSKMKNLDFEGQYLEPLHFAFKSKAGASFKSSVTSDYYNNIGYLKDAIKRFFWKFTPLFIVSALVLGASVYFSPKFGFEGAALLNKVNAYKTYIGTYTGEFDNRTATLQITNLTSNEATATISVKYTNDLTEQLRGTINLETNAVHFDDMISNSNLDGEYNGTLDPETKTISGIYQNYKTKKQVAFNFQMQN
jgi:serine/threonine protein kinase